MKKKGPRHRAASRTAPPTPTGAFAREIRVQDIKFDDANPNAGTKRGHDLLDRSLDMFGAGRSGVLSADNVVLAGNKTVEEATAKGMKLAVIDSDGKTLFLIRRTDLRSDDPRAVGYKIADNQVALVGIEWDPKVMARLATEKLPALEDFMFPEELERILSEPLAAEQRAEAPPSEEPPSAAGKMVSLFLSQEGFEEFTILVTALAAKYGTDNVTDTVMAALRKESTPTDA